MLRTRSVRIRRRLKASDEFYRAAGYGAAILETCTYRLRGSAVDPKDDISKHVEARQAWWKRNHSSELPLVGDWVAEPQGDGTVHYHLVWWVPVKSNRYKLPMNAWRHGRSEVRWVRKSVVGYMSKYLSKMPYGLTERQRELKVRISGEAWGKLRIYYRKLRTYSVQVPGDAERERFASMPRAMQSLCGRLGWPALVRRKGGGWWCPDGRWVESAYEVVGCVRGFFYLRLNPRWSPCSDGGVFPTLDAFHDAGELPVPMVAAYSGPSAADLTYKRMEKTA